MGDGCPGARPEWEAGDPLGSKAFPTRTQGWGSKRRDCHEQSSGRESENQAGRDEAASMTSGAAGSETADSRCLDGWSVTLAQGFWPPGTFGNVGDLEGQAGWQAVLLASSGVEDRDASKCSPTHRTAPVTQSSCPKCQLSKQRTLTRKKVNVKHAHVSLFFPGNANFEDDDTRQSDALD